MLVDLAQYAIGMRSEIRVDFNPFENFRKGIVAFKATVRVDGQSLADTTATGAEDDVVFSPFVQLPAIA